MSAGGGGLIAKRVLGSAAMSDFVMYALVPIAVGAVAVVLLMGLNNMARGGSPHRSQKPCACASCCNSWLSS